MATNGGCSVWISASLAGNCSVQELRLHPVRCGAPVSYTHLDVYKRQDYYSGMQVLVPLDLKLAGTSAEAVAAGIADYRCV